MLLYLFILGSSLIFIFMLIAYSFNKVVFYDIELPKEFIVSMVIMLVSSFNISRITAAFEEENILKIRNQLIITLIFGLAFAVLLFIGWGHLKDSGVFIPESRSGTYLYVITGLHLMHFVIAMLLLSVLLVEVLRQQKDPVKVLVKMTNPYEKLKLEILNTYWQFLTILWMILFFYFLFTF